MHTLCYCTSLYSLPMASEDVSRLPPYTLMIFTAIDALKEKEGSSESSISGYIESTCGYLPDEHTTILTDSLKKLVDDGELVLLNNKYMRPDPASPLKRGRGRPKAKDPAPAGLESGSQAEAGSEIKRGRGRPKKDPNAPPAPKKVKVASVASKTGRPRGRPRKVQPELAGVEAN